MPQLHRAQASCAVLALLALLLFAPSVRAACTGLGSAASYSSGTSPRMLVRGDFNRDGIDDLASANGTGATLSVLLGLGANGIGNGAFAAPIMYASGATAIGLATGDLDGDGNADLAVGVSSGVAIWRGSGTGTFTGGAIIAAGSGLRGVVSADFDRDGIDDLALTSSNTNSVLVLRGLGGGAFAAAVSLTAGTSPTRIVCADFDDDGAFDLACSNNTSANVSVFRGDGNGGFAAATHVAAPGSPWGLVALDADRDGRPDLLVSNGAGSTMTLLRGNGAGGFASAGNFATPLAPRDLAVADVDGDGAADVIAACTGTNQVCVLRGLGGGFVAFANFAVGAGAASVCVGDFNSDGSPDLACANTTANNVSRLLGTCPAPASATVALLAPNGGESWWPLTEQTVRWSKGAGIAGVDVDLSRDGGVTWLPLARGTTGDHLRVNANGAASEQMRVRVRDSAIASRADASDATFAVCGVLRAGIRTPVGFAATQLERADLDGDGLDDVVAASSNQAVVLHGIGNGRFAPGAPFAVDAAHRVRLTDVNGDGLADLVTLGDTKLAWRAGDGAGGFDPAHLVTFAGGVDFVAADFDADGLDDAALLVNDLSGSRLVVRYGAGTPLVSEWSAPLSGAPTQLVSSDLDGDGIADLAIALGSALQVWRGMGVAGRGDGRFAHSATRSIPGGAGELSLGDFDRDGRLDVAACALTSGDVWTVASEPIAGSFDVLLGTPTATPAGGTPRSPVVADFDGDGFADMAVIVPGSSEVRVLKGTATGFALPLAFPGGSGALVSGDFVHDSATDLLLARPDSNDVLCLGAYCPPLAPATIQLTSRHAGERWTTGFAQRVAWTRTPAVALARVELSRDGGSHWLPIASAITDSQLTWIVTGPSCDHVRVRVCDASSSTREDVSAEFAIVAAFDGVQRFEPSAAAVATSLTLGTPHADGRSDAVVVAGGRVARVNALGERVDLGEANIRRAQLTDLDGDGFDELLMLTPTALLVRRGQADGSFGLARNLGTAGANVAMVTSDFDEDGETDLAVACGSAPAQRVMLWRGLGLDVDGRMAFGAATQVALPSPATALTSGDADGDGVLDLFVAHGAGLSTLLGNGVSGHGDGSFRLAATRAFGAGAVCALTEGDFDGDGHMDIAGTDSTLGALLVSAGNGAGGFATPVVAAAAAGACDVAWGDFDGDGTPDLALASHAGVALLRGSRRIAADGFAPAALLSPGGTPRMLALRDTDGDGTPEATVLDGASGALTVLRGSVTSGATLALDSPAALHPAVGAEVTLHWSGLLAADLDVSSDDGAHWKPLARGVQGGVFRWTVAGPPSGLARLRVRDAFAPLRMVTTSAFVINPSTLNVAPALPAIALLGHVTPNPSHGTVTIELALPRASDARVEVCDVAGRHVRALHRGPLAAGRHTLAWDGRSDAGDPLPPGTYFVRARAAGVELSGRVVRVR